MTGDGRTRWRWFDILLTLGLLAFGLLGTAGAHRNQHMTATPLAYVLVVLACLPILLWRTRPLSTFAATCGVTLAYLALGYAYGPILFALAVAILGVALWSPLRRTLIAMGVLLPAAAVIIGAGVLAGSRGWIEVVTTATWLVIPAAVGVTIKTRRDAAADVRSEQARRAASEERLRLAQEVHDVAGHGFAMIAMQAGVALRVLDRDPAGARAALEGIRAASREALESLRAEVDAMRQPGAPLRPASGLADLPALVDRLRSTGLPVTIDAAADLGEVPPEVDRTAYRIVQESLTNVLRHAGSDATARVDIRRADRGSGGDQLSIEVADTGRGAAMAATGRGIAGMRARAQTLGGTLDAGPTRSGGFAVRARLPLHGAEAGGPAR